MVEITEIKIKVSDTKTIKLTIAEAKELMSALEEMLGDHTIIKEEHHHHYQWYYTPPVTVDPTPWQPNGPYVTYSANSVSIDLTGNTTF